MSPGDDNKKSSIPTEADFERARRADEETRAIAKLVEGDLGKRFSAWMGASTLYVQRDSQRAWEILTLVPTETALASAQERKFLDWGYEAALDSIQTATAVARDEIRLLLEIESEENVSRHFRHMGNRLRNDGRRECCRMSSDFFAARADDWEREHGRKIFK